MPLYEYHCEACGARFELIRKFADPPLAVCPTCGKGPIQKLVSSPAFQFKGSGWYVTDYARKSGGDDAKSGDKAPSAGGESSDSKSSDSRSSDSKSSDSKSSDSKPSDSKSSEPTASKESRSSDKPVAPPSSSKDS